ncbi:MAG: hypothetical protein ACM3XO_15295 [Bacteroidota bacterium]
MKVNRTGLFWGILLIGAGAIALGQQLGYIQQFTDPQFWIWVFAIISLASVVEYALSGWKQWGWLFPAGALGGVALVITLAINNVNSAAVASPIFFGLLIPFAAAYLTDRTRNWWALIPGGIMLFLALTLLLVDNVGGEWVGAMLFLMFALAFLIVYLTNRTRTWALLVAYIFGVLSLAPMLAAFDDMAGYFGAILMFAIALPFFIVYFRSPENNWWAIIPAGALSVIGVIAAVAITGLITDITSGGYVNAFLMAGLAATFAVLWMRHHKDWARIVTIVLGILAVASLFFFGYYELFWPVAFICGGIYLLYIALRPKQAA